MLRKVVQSEPEIVSLNLIESFEEGAGDITVGRSSGSIFRLARLVSQDHALLRRRPPNVTLSDLGTTNGT